MEKINWLLDKLDFLEIRFPRILAIDWKLNEKSNEHEFVGWISMFDILEFYSIEIKRNQTESYDKLN